MSNSLISLNIKHLPGLLEFADHIYENSDPDKYPDFKITLNDINNTAKRTKFFSAFMLDPEFVDYDMKQCYAVVNDNGEYVAAVGVKRFEHMPSWSLSWLLSPAVGVKFIPTFRVIVQELCVIHEAAGMNEFYVTYPSNREAAYSKIMLPFRERYYSFDECTVPARTRSHYSLVYTLMGEVLHPHDITIRRYILRRENTEPHSKGGTAKKLRN